ncbi:diguanylate cyclase (GGDEF)-like protein/PAS domain S-box-containing protein [Luteibacter jiangsuensis]|uniref:Diguanylate cyclase (GGDEF)-like protein/PAS domain S-box-containing protein n=1 Tax=Luteibacter jiangsuensis TaxID=637577 RepID=A0ABT9T2M8_9GAMM|nr:EAL domain-containing protein [Luteibacter jiangsuensis]MDQ0010778.1 diguanylate cyclase (GGDEF)-like protein/PAS domain S-box-containing protein [Luteibacter jiangsuensis]
MRRLEASHQQLLSRRLRPLAYALVAVVGLILTLTWVALQTQVTLAGFLNGESLWSKAQKQSVIDLDAYAAHGRPADLAGFRRNYAVLMSDRWARDAIASGDFSHADVNDAFARGGVIPEAIPGMVFIFQYFDGMPYVREAVSEWRSVDGSLADLEDTADRLEKGYGAGTLQASDIVLERSRIAKLNDYIEPRAKAFSLYIANGASWLGRVLFFTVLGVAALASSLWLRMAGRILAGIRGTEERYSLLFDSAADAIFMVDEETGRILDANRRAASWLGCSREELSGMELAALFVDGSPHTGVGSLRNPDGSLRPVETQSSLVVWGARQVSQAIVRDISDRVAMEQERKIASEALASIAEGVIIADADRRVTTANAAHTKLTGFPVQALRRTRFDITRTLPDGRPLPQSLWDDIAAGDNWVGEVESRRADGSTYPELMSISTIRDRDGRPQHYVAVVSDITARKADRQRLQHLATHDPLTGLVTRSEFERRCAEAITRAAHERGAVAVLFVDLDAFKVVNDSYSHATGDALLMRVAERIRAQLSPHDVAGRIGGDEFTVLLADLRSREEALVVAETMLAALARPFDLGDYELYVSASIGIAGYPLDGNDAVTLIANADAAMYVAKTEERNALRFYTPKMHADARRRLKLASELRQALIRNEFYLVYQPSIEMKSGRIVAVEALIRWRHPERGNVAPDEFIPIAESLGLIRQIDQWVLETACRQLLQWDEARLPPLRMAVNVSAGSFGHPDFLQGVCQALQEIGIPPKRLLVELTESAILRLGEDTERAMLALHNLGVAVAIDDFGTGYSSLAYLKLPAVAYLKIDRSFVTGLPMNANDVAITEAMVAIARSLDLHTIAEGIETEGQHEFLLRAGCQEGQGFLYSRPLPPDEIERLLAPRTTGSKRLSLVPPKRA